MIMDNQKPDSALHGFVTENIIPCASLRFAVYFFRRLQQIYPIYIYDNLPQESL